MRKQHVLKGLIMFALLGSLAARAAVLGPVYPAPGGNTFVGSGGNAGDAGGHTNSYSGFDTSAFSALYWGPSSASLPAAGLDGSLHTLTFTGFSGDVATWTGTSGYTNPTTNVFVPNAQITLDITIAGLGANPWTSFSSVNGSDPTGVGAVVNDSAGSNFSATLAFFANTGSGLQPLNTVLQLPGNLTQSSFSGAFYSAAPVPLPAAGWLLVSGLGSLGVFRKRKAQS